MQLLLTLTKRNEQSGSTSEWSFLLNEDTGKVMVMFSKQKENGEILDMWSRSMTIGAFAVQADALTSSPEVSFINEALIEEIITEYLFDEKCYD